MLPHGPDRWDLAAPCSSCCSRVRCDTPGQDAGRKVKIDTRDFRRFGCLHPPGKLLRIRIPPHRGCVCRADMVEGLTRVGNRLTSSCCATPGGRGADERPSPGHAGEAYLL